MLLDTEVLIWSILAPERLSALAYAVCESANYEPCVSAASLWEMIIKVQAGKWTLEDPANWFDQWTSGMRHLNISRHDIKRLYGLPLFHKDPFDRILMAQAIHGGMPLITCDRKMRNYPQVNCVWD